MLRGVRTLSILSFDLSLSMRTSFCAEFMYCVVFFPHVPFVACRRSRDPSLISHIFFTSSHPITLAAETKLTPNNKTGCRSPSRRPVRLRPSLQSSVLRTQRLQQRWKKTRCRLLSVANSRALQTTLSARVLPLSLQTCLTVEVLSGEA
jgi:hypothetical protein